MAHTKSAKKRARIAVENRERNREAKALIKERAKTYLAALATKDAPKADAAVRELASVLDKSFKRGIITKNTAVRRKQRAMNKLLALKKASAA